MSALSIVVHILVSKRAELHSDYMGIYSESL